MVGVRARGPYTWSARRLSITTTTTFIAPGGAGWRWKLDLPEASSLSQPAAPSRPRPAAPAPPALLRRRRVTSWLNWLGPAPRDVDRADRVLVRELVHHLAHDLVNVPLVVAEVVAERLQRRPGDLQLRGGQVEPVRDLVRPDQVELFVCHGSRNSSRARGRVARTP